MDKQTKWLAGILTALFIALVLIAYSVEGRADDCHPYCTVAFV